jgi:RNA polymerase-binding protein DksA
MTGDKKKKTEKAASKVSSKNPKTISKKVPGKTTVKTSGKTAGKTPGKTPVKASGKAANKTSVKTPGKAAGKSASKERPPQVSMSKAEWDVFIEKMEKLLQEEKTEIINTLIANNNDFKEIVDGMDPKDLADIASDDIDRRMIEMLGSQELKRLKLIESAQTRIKQGKYGHCIKCDKPIPPERLEAIPYALMCIDCKSEEERRNR